MPNHLASPGLVVSPAGNVLPSSFVTVDANYDFQCRQATATTDKIVGVSQVGIDQPPNLGAIFGSTAAQVAGQPGEQISIHSVGDVAPITLGTGGCSPNDLLTADSSGNGVVASGGNYYGGLALQAGNAGEIISMLVLFGKA
jgi:hypothetical protein